MTPIARFERVLKDLDRCTAYAVESIPRHGSLADKVAAQRVRRILADTRRTLRLQYHAFEDAVRPLATADEELDR